MCRRGRCNDLPEVQQQIVAGRVDVAGRVCDHGGERLLRQPNAYRLVIPKRFRTQLVETEREATQQGSNEQQARVGGGCARGTRGVHQCKYSIAPGFMFAALR